MKRGTILAATLLVTLGTGLAAILFPPLRDAIGIAPGGPAPLRAAERLFNDAMTDPGSRSLVAEAASIGLEVSAGGADWEGVRIAEPAGMCEGRGIYLLRDGNVRPVALTAPHRGADRNTGTLAAQLFLETGAAAAAWNSAPRKPTSDCPAALDLAKAPRHPFTGFALAFADRFPQGRIVQLHGFDRSKRADEAGRSAGIILSNGTMEPEPGLLDLADCLSVALAPYPVRVFPYETGELGALTNAQGEALRGKGFAGFVHLEMAEDLRAALVADEMLRAQLAQCLFGGLE
ncbi:hypothetical protein [Parerythrobacter aestuarii]|uniref:hypothetical protein n=1 Tax=Parerythrobacter aestuarii TaxID=3020909 RepID=UPI0024DE714D|nr:hypothetical protein [Parerythrobacter aestuarii]